MILKAIPKRASLLKKKWMLLETPVLPNVLFDFYKGILKYLGFFKDYEESEF